MMMHDDYVDVGVGVVVNDEYAGVDGFDTFMCFSGSYAPFYLYQTEVVPNTYVYNALSS